MFISAVNIPTFDDLQNRQLIPQGVADEEQDITTDVAIRAGSLGSQQRCLCIR